MHLKYKFKQIFCLEKIFFYICDFIYIIEISSENNIINEVICY